jgi:hypothetical protein
MYCVLHPGGLSVIADLGCFRKKIDREVKGIEFDYVDRFHVRWTFAQVLLKSAYRGDEMKKMTSQTSFGKCKINASSVGFQVPVEKYSD